MAKVWCRATTDVSHVSRGENLARMISIPRRYRPERTMLLSLHGANHGRCCDFSKDPEERASFEYRAVIYHLPDNFQHLQIEMATSRYTDVSICPYRSPLHVEFLTPSQIWKLVHCYQQTVPRASQTASPDALPSSGEGD